MLILLEQYFKKKQTFPFTTIKIKCAQTYEEKYCHWLHVNIQRTHLRPAAMLVSSEFSTGTNSNRKRKRNVRKHHVFVSCCRFIFKSVTEQPDSDWKRQLIYYFSVRFKLKTASSHREVVFLSAASHHWEQTLTKIYFIFFNLTSSPQTPTSAFQYHGHL